MSTTQELEFNSGTLRHVVSVPIVDNTISENIEQFSARLTLVSSGADVELNFDEAAVSIIDDDG